MADTAAVKIDLGMEAEDPYKDFRETAEGLHSARDAANDPYYSPADVMAFSSKPAQPTSPLTVLAAAAAPGVSADPAPKTAKDSAPQVDPKVQAFLAADIQKANRPGGDMSQSVRVTDNLAQQGRQFEEAKQALVNPDPNDQGPKRDILGQRVEEPGPVARGLITFGSVVGGGVAVAAAGVVLGPKFAGAVGLGLAAKDVGGFVSAVNGGARTAEQNVILDSQYKEPLPMRGGRGKQYAAEQRAAGPTVEQQQRLASVSGGGGGAIRVDGAGDLSFRAGNAQESLSGIKGARLDPNDPTVVALNRRGQELNEQMATQRMALTTPATTSWNAVAHAQQNGLNISSERTTFDKLVPKEQLAQLNGFKAPSLTV